MERVPGTLRTGFAVGEDDEVHDPALILSFGDVFLQDLGRVTRDVAAHNALESLTGREFVNCMKHLFLSEEGRKLVDTFEFIGQEDEGSLPPMTSGMQDAARVMAEAYPRHKARNDELMGQEGNSRRSRLSSLCDQLLGDYGYVEDQEDQDEGADQEDQEDEADDAMQEEQDEEEEEEGQRITCECELCASVARMREVSVADVHGASPLACDILKRLHGLETAFSSRASSSS